MVHLDHLLQPKPIRLRLFSSSQITGSIEEPFAPVKRLRTNWLLGVPRMKRRRIGFSTDTARDKGPNRETDPKQGAKGCSWRYTSLPRGHANIPPSPVRWRYVCVCSPTSQVASSKAYPFPQFKPLLINWLFGKFRLIRRRIDFEHADVRQLGDGKSATRELLEDCRLKRRRIGSLPRGCKMTAGRRGLSTQPDSNQAALETRQPQACRRASTANPRADRPATHALHGNRRGKPHSAP